MMLFERMKKIDLGQAISILANVGVIAGLVFLGAQLRQNNDLLGIELRSALMDRQTSMVDVVLSNSDVDLLDLMSQSAEDLSASDRQKLVLLGMRMLIVVELGFEEARAGLRNEDDLVRLIRSVYRRPVLNYGAPLAWETYRERAPPEFIEWMEEYILTGE